MSASGISRHTGVERRGIHSFGRNPPFDLLDATGDFIAEGDVAATGVKEIAFSKLGPSVNRAGVR